ncbi:hypothetical protein DES53_11572 [Roseimicrobium gellanilyticum]|uniref:Uncharacterized protein n=1 Tax=Roseimicrobium gellanilyticum TaxID=748857 RepID=A0A366H636_9BACT|nr:hypothetical protein [Roseimicrobium gellanilyticum]RBP36931.1 hypothetical protein DES53_11572 [Roseimicrobium gellanilyticum]
MSRRTKLIILALFLVLLAIPMAYVTLTWRPVDPLRFRMLNIETPSKFHPLEVAHRVLYLEVENTASTTVRMGSAMIMHGAEVHEIQPRTGKRTILLDRVVNGAISTDMMEDVVLPPRGRWQGRIHLPFTVEETWPLEESAVGYNYVSSSRHRVLSWYRSLRLLLPKSWSKQLPEPEVHRAAAPLEASE